MISYAQQDEDLIALEILGDVTGRFLDIGAFDGVTHSNTRLFAGLGWGGVYVEPEARAFTALRRNRDGPFEFLQALVDVRAYPRLKKFWVADDASVSTVDERHRKRWEDQAGVVYAGTYVASVTPLDLLEAFPGPYDLVSIDTEGTSDVIAMEVLASLRPYPRVVIVEHGYETDELFKAMAYRGYLLEVTNANNTIWVCNDS